MNSKKLFCLKGIYRDIPLTTIIVPLIYRQLPVIEKSQPIAPKEEIKSGAQHQTLRGRKHFYKNSVALIPAEKAVHSSVCNLQIYLRHRHRGSHFKIIKSFITYKSVSDPSDLKDQR